MRVGRKNLLLKCSVPFCAKGALVSAASSTERRLRLALAQINPTVGDLVGNTQRIVTIMEHAAAQSVHLLCFPELALTGYPPEDLLLKPNFIRDARHALDVLITRSQSLANLTTIIGFVERSADLYNAAAIVHSGELAGIYHKHFLPNYGVFDENRYFQSGQEPDEYVNIYIINGVQVGVSICEDIWYPTGPATLQGYAGAEVLANISASPFHQNKWHWREHMLSTRASDTGSIVAYVNMVGGQDEIVFDGGSSVFDERGQLIARAPSFTEDLLIIDLAIEGVFRQRLHDPRLRKARLDVHGRAHAIMVSPFSNSPEPLQQKEQPITPVLDEVEEVYKGLVLGTRDYVHKNGFKDVVIALSGGIDSALTATIAVDALGKEHVHGALMPSQFSSQHSIDDAAKLAENLGIQHCIIPIQSTVDSFLEALIEPIGGPAQGITNENLQSRTRGVFLMALSNNFNWLVLTTGNKSEMATGYATMYGDMAGGFAVLKDVWKTMVYRLAHSCNIRAGYDLIPRNTIEKPPSAELRPDQQDTDSLPEYSVLDPILQAYVEDDRSLNEIVTLGYPEEMVRRVLQMVDHSEYKRRQAAPGIKVTPRAFGRDRRLPLTSRYHEWKD
jgi:NAD+ synthase (glutamine-hydrolysing)